MFTKGQRRLIWLSSLGGILEFYDFIIYALLANYIALNFFPVKNHLTSLLITFAAYSIGYLVRPLGGILFSHFGDKYGRKKTFAFSIFLMASSTFLIAFVPTYAAIGIAGPVIITLLRVFQGLSIGGEIPGAVAYLCESMPEKKGLACGFILFMILNGVVLGSLIIALLNAYFTNTQMLSWGWRIPFFVGGFFGFLSYFLRRELEESRLFLAIEKHVHDFPLKQVLQVNRDHVVAGIFIVALQASAISLFFLFLPSYFSGVLHMPSQNWPLTFTMFCAASLALVFGWLADKFCMKQLVFIFSLFGITLAYPIFTIFVNYPHYYFLAYALCAFFIGCTAGVIPCFLSGLFPTDTRYTGIAVTYNVGFAIFGGLTPLVSVFLIEQLHNKIAPAYYFMTVAIISLLALILVELPNPRE